jgi:hypothetical protein
VPDGYSLVVKEVCMDPNGVFLFAVVLLFLAFYEVSKEWTK